LRKADVLNRGFSGYNTEWLAAMLPSVFPPMPSPPGFAPVLVTIWFGANDAVLESSGIPQFVSVEK
jgi:lysophospholipase L1-like esterase